MKIHAIQTGTVRIRASQAVGRGRGPIRRANILLDRTWTGPLPILAWAIETVDGVVVVDTGETARVAEPGYFPRWHPYYRMAVRFEVAPADEIGPQLRGLGIEPEDVKAVVLTHLHTDHSGGLHHFPRSEILASEEEWGLARGVAGMLRGYLPDRWPGWLAPRPIPFGDGPIGPFGRSHRVTSDGKVAIVPTPGHTPGHVTVIVEDGGLGHFLAGDASYSQTALLEGWVDGLSPSEATSVRTMGEILRYARERPTVYLPAHDPESTDRLARSITVPVVEA